MNRRYVIASAILTMGLLLTGCGSKQEVDDTELVEIESVTEEVPVIEEEHVAWHGESGSDGMVDLAALREYNPDLIGWMCVPGTDLDYPIFCTTEEELYYESHNGDREEDERGAVHTLFYNLTDFSDFNTIIYGKTTEDGNGGQFKDMYKFADEDYFNQHNKMFIFVDGGTLEYEIIAAYERDKKDVMAVYNLVEINGCNQFLQDEYETHVMGGHYRTEWEGITGYNYLVQLNTSLGDNSEKEYVILALLTQDQNGLVHRANMY